MWEWKLWRSIKGFHQCYFWAYVRNPVKQWKTYLFVIRSFCNPIGHGFPTAPAQEETCAVQTVTLGLAEPSYDRGEGYSTYNCHICPQSRSEIFFSQWLVFKGPFTPNASVNATTTLWWRWPYSIVFNENSIPSSIAELSQRWYWRLM